MARQPIIEQRPWWPDALKRFEQLAAEGQKAYRAALAIAHEFGVAEPTASNAILRGSVPSYPSSDPERAEAFQSGKSRYKGRDCKKHGSVERFSSDGKCVECVVEYDLATRVKKEGRIG